MAESPYDRAKAVVDRADEAERDDLARGRRRAARAVPQSSPSRGGLPRVERKIRPRVPSDETAAKTKAPRSGAFVQGNTNREELHGMTDEPTLETIATEASSWFETATRPDGGHFTRCKDDAPEWVRELVYRAHGGMLPDDWKYSCIEDAVDWIADGNDPDEPHDFADQAVDTYTADRTDWLGSHSERQGYVDEAVREFGADPDAGIVGMIALGQYQEASEVFTFVRESLQERLDEVLEEIEDEAVQA